MKRNREEPGIGITAITTPASGALSSGGGGGPRDGKRPRVGIDDLCVVLPSTGLASGGVGGGGGDSDGGPTRGTTTTAAEATDASRRREAETETEANTAASTDHVCASTSTSSGGVGAEVTEEGGDAQGAGKKERTRTRRRHRLFLVTRPKPPPEPDEIDLDDTDESDEDSDSSEEEAAEQQDKEGGDAVKDDDVFLWDDRPLQVYIDTAKAMSRSIYDHSDEGFADIDSATQSKTPIPPHTAPNTIQIPQQHNPTPEQPSATTSTTSASNTTTTETSSAASTAQLSEHDDDVLVGMLLLVEEYPECEILQLFVDPEWRTQGIGGQLVCAAIDYARKSEYHPVAVNCFAVGSWKFYRKWGFKKEKSPDNKGGERVVMKLLLENSNNKEES
ncbi:hypothetical protein Pelo_9490 [Pelomyxa schiedti]|nr:hypothetical protein Pelo_9490 [Pelomyxa schiedti]